MGAILFNFGDEDFTVNMGDRIAQLIFEKIKTPTIKETNDLEGTRRGEGSYGSTGVNAVQTGVKSDFKQSSSSAVSVSVQEIKQTSSDQNTESSQRMKREPKSDLNSKQTPLSQSRQIISARQIQKLAKEDSPVFLAIVRKTNMKLPKNEEIKDLPTVRQNLQLPTY